jgi:hypothetical protein
LEAVVTDTGSVAEGRKDDDGKARYDLIPGDALHEVAKLYGLGAVKYADRDWEQGMRWGRIFAAMMRHAWAWWRGEKLDPENGQYHLASVAWCALALLSYELRDIGRDDRCV